MAVGHLNRWERIAVVTNSDWIKYSIKMFSFMIPCPVKVFPLNDTAEARVWIEEG